MSLKHQLLAAAYQPLKLGNTLLRKVSGHHGGRLRVLLYHDIAPTDEARFEVQLRWLSRSWRFITPSDFAAMIFGDEPLVEDCLLLTFDDGFASNRRTAETVLNPMGIKALFFIVSEFAALSDTADWRGFVAQNIYPGLQPENVPAYWRNMSWDDLAYLLETGHSIGAHTAYHARLSQVTPVDLAEEIILSADVLEQKLGIKVDHFAYTFGDLASFSPDSLAVARSRFQFIYTGLRGLNACGVPPWAIRRDAVYANDSLSLLGALLEGGADGFYTTNLAVYESWGQEA
jgi:peptidoglycan/xylan/chitin deacetylase (PgdA/CDA1 family)